MENSKHRLDEVFSGLFDHGTSVPVDIVVIGPFVIGQVESSLEKQVNNIMLDH